MPPTRIGILTGGGDCPGLNAVIRAVTRAAMLAGIEVIGISDGFLGLIEDRTRLLSDTDVSNILATGGTILGSSNKANPTSFAVGKDEAGKPVMRDVSDRCIKTIRRERLEALVLIGGDGTMSAAAGLLRHDGCADINWIGVPKTIDNDLHGTDLTFGFLTAVSIASEAIDRVHTTAASHHRIMAVEVMGRNAGWIALHAGIASGADFILLPEIPFDLDRIAEGVLARRERGKKFSILCVAEGAKLAGGEQIVARRDPTSPDPVRLGGVGKFVADELEKRTGVESRYVVLGHVQRGGPPIAADRVLATQFGHHAVKLLLAGARNRMVAIRDWRLTDVDIASAAGRQRTVHDDHHLLDAARAVGTSFGNA